MPLPNTTSLQRLARWSSKRDAGPRVSSGYRASLWRCAAASATPSPSGAPAWGCHHVARATLGLRHKGLANARQLIKCGHDGLCCFGVSNASLGWDKKSLHIHVFEHPLAFVGRLFVAM